MKSLYIKKPMKMANCVDLKKFLFCDRYLNSRKYQHKKGKTQNITISTKNVNNKLCFGVTDHHTRNNKILNKTSESLVDPHEKKIQNELNEHKKMLEQRYKSSIVNDRYVFPRTLNYKPTEEIGRAHV